MQIAISVSHDIPVAFTVAAAQKILYPIAVDVHDPVVGIEGTLPAETVLVNLEQLVVRGLDILRFQVATQGQPAFVKGIVYQRLPVQLNPRIFCHDSRGLVLRNLRTFQSMGVCIPIPLTAPTLNSGNYVPQFPVIFEYRSAVCKCKVRMAFTIPIPVRCLI